MAGNYTSILNIDKDNKEDIKNAIETVKNSYLKDHENKMCVHSTDGKLNYGICWSWIFESGSDKGLISAGPPCKNNFEKYKLQLV